MEEPQANFSIKREILVLIKLLAVLETLYCPESTSQVELTQAKNHTQIIPIFMLYFIPHSTFSPSFHQKQPNRSRKLERYKAFIIKMQT